MIFAPAQARNARVPLVVVLTMILPRTFSRLNSRGELPKSKSAPPDRVARILTPSRSPASSASGNFSRKAMASGISLTGMTACAPLCSAVTNVLVARRTSNTTHAVPRKSRGQFRRRQEGVNFHLAQVSILIPIASSH